jgi:hypothetical protein
MLLACVTIVGIPPEYFSDIIIFLAAWAVRMVNTPYYKKEKKSISCAQRDRKTA